MKERTATIIPIKPRRDRTDDRRVIWRHNRVGLVRRGGRKGSPLSIRWWNQTKRRYDYKTSGTSVLKEAKKIAIDFDDQLRRGKGYPVQTPQVEEKPSAPTLWSAIAEAIDASRANERTHDQYVACAQKFKEWVKRTHPGTRLYTDMTLAMVKKYIRDMEKKKLAYDTIRQRVSVLRMTALHMTSYGYPNPLALVRVRRTEPPKVRVWRDEHIRAFLEWGKKRYPNLYSAWLLQALCGLRGMEALFMRECDIDWDQKTITVTDTPWHAVKNLYSKRTLPACQFVLDELRWCIEQRKGNKHRGCISTDFQGEPWNETQRYHRVSDIFLNYVRRHATKGTPYCSSKDLRKSFSTLCETQLGVSGVALGAYLGHSPMGIRHQRYSDVRDVEFLRREVAEKVEAWMRRDDNQS
jgi:integrase